MTLTEEYSAAFIGTTVVAVAGAAAVAVFIRRPATQAAEESVDQYA